MQLFGKKAQAPIAPAVASPQPAQSTSHQDTHSESIMNKIGRRYIVPVAVVIDMIAFLVRIVEGGMLLLLPDQYKWLDAHKDIPSSVLFYTSNVLVLAAIALGVASCVILVFPLIYQIDKRIEAAGMIKNKKRRNDRQSFLKGTRQKYYVLAGMTGIMIVIFASTYVLRAFLPGDIVAVITAVSDILAPLISYYVISQTEQEYNSQDATERASKQTTRVVVDRTADIAGRFGQGITRGDVAILRAGIDGDIHAMLDAAVPFETTEKTYSIADICAKLNVPADRDSPNRKKIYRIIAKAFREGDPGVGKTEKEGYKMAGDAWDRLFGNYEHVPEAIRLVNDRTKAS